MKKLIVVFIAFLAVSNLTIAQKFGFCNGNELLASLKEVKDADLELETYQKQLTKKGQDMVAALQAKAADLEKKNAEGLLAPKEAENQKAALAQEEQSILAYEQEVYKILAKKREELYQPILDKVNKAMNDVAKENGFAMIFDKGTEVIIYASETLDVTALIKTKLGI